MKKHPTFIVSAILNAILAGVVIWLVSSRPAEQPQSTPTARPMPSATPVGETDLSRRDDISTIQEPLSSTRTSTQAQRTISPLGALLDRLRKAGISENVLAELIAAQHAEQRRQWRFDQLQKIRRGEADPAGLGQMNQQWDEELEQTMRATLGDEAFVRWDKQNVLERIAGDTLLSDTEADALYQMEKERQQKQRDLSQTHWAGEIDPQDYQKQNSDLRQEYDQRIAAVLGAERAGQLKQDTDWNLAQTRWNLRDMNLTEAQFDALFQASQRANEQSQELQRLAQSGTKVDGSQWREIQNTKEREIEQALGSQNYGEYQMRQDYRYQQMTRYAPAWKLTSADINQVYKMLSDGRRAVENYRKQAQSVQSQGQRVDWNEISRGVAEYRKEVETELRRYLGDERYDRLQRAGVVSPQF